MAARISAILVLLAATPLYNDKGLLLGANFCGISAADPYQRFQCLISPASLGQPARAFLEEEHSDPQDNRRDELQPDGNLPLLRERVGDMLDDTIVDPIRGHDADSEEELEQASQLATDLFWGHLGGVYRHHDRCHPDPDPGNHTRGIESADMASRGHLDDSPDGKNDRGQAEGTTTAESRSKRPDEEAREERCSCQLRQSNSAIEQGTTYPPLEEDW